MARTVPVILISLVFFLTMIVNMALRKDDGRSSVFVALAGSIIGTFFYGYGYSIKYEYLPVAITRTVMSVCGMFVGRWEVANIDDLPLFKSPLILCLFLLSHFMAFYSFVNVVLMKLGSSVLKKIRIRLLRKNRLSIIYGVSDETILFANRVRDGRKLGDTPVSILFILEHNDSGLAQAVERNGFAFRTDSDAQHPNERFLKSLGIRPGDHDRKITLYALSAEENRNRRYASELLETLRKFRIPAENLSLTIYTDSPEEVYRMQALKHRYGYADVNPFELQSLTARLLTLEYPVCSTIRFREDGVALDDVDILIAGFGATGQAVLRSFVRNGQFEGSHFHAAVFAPEIASIAGRFFTVCEELFSEYSIDFYQHDARSVNAVEYVKKHAKTLRYVVACTEDEKADWEIIRCLEAVSGKYSENIFFLICGKGTVTNIELFNVGDTITDIWRNEILTPSVSDRAAKAVNASYHTDENATQEELWRSCTPFSRESCRAAADFMTAYCHIAGISEEEAARGKWDLSPELLENLAKTEHLRWNAFHRSMGWKAMSDKEFAERAAIYRRQKQEGSTPLIRIAKNDADRHHACLVSWEELKELSEMENEVTGRDVDYQQFDRDNVLAVPSMLRAFGL